MFSVLIRGENAVHPEYLSLWVKCVVYKWGNYLMFRCFPITIYLIKTFSMIVLMLRNECFYLNDKFASHDAIWNTEVWSDNFVPKFLVHFPWDTLQSPHSYHGCGSRLPAGTVRCPNFTREVVGPTLEVYGLLGEVDILSPARWTPAYGRLKKAALVDFCTLESLNRCHG